MWVEVAVIVLLIWAWRVFNWVWLRPKKLERYLRRQGLAGNSYRLLFGDLKQSSVVTKEALSKPINFTNDIVPRAHSFVYQTLKDYGKISFTWHGPVPRVNIMEPELVKEILSKDAKFPKPDPMPLFKLLTTGLTSYKGEKWAKHRKIINPAFHMEKLKHMLPAMYLSCGKIMSKWENLVSTNGSYELDVWPDVQTLARDMLSRTAFGSNYEEGTRIFELQKEQSDLTIQAMRSVYIPGWRFLPTKRNKRMKAISREVLASIGIIVNKRVDAMKAGEPSQNDLLGILLESNLREIQENGKNIERGMTIAEVVEECRLFYVAGQVTTSSFLVWTMVLLAKHTDWQQRARAEVFEIFGSNAPDSDGLSRLKTVTMILHEVLRLYPPPPAIIRNVEEDTDLKGLHLPSGVEIVILGIVIHHDREVWGDDAGEFRPERFSEGVSKASKRQGSYFPFGLGPRICIGQNFAVLEAKVAISMILQRFWFELSPSYTHAPFGGATLQPQHGAHLILHKYEGK